MSKGPCEVRYTARAELTSAAAPGLRALTAPPTMMRARGKELAVVAISSAEMAEASGHVPTHARPPLAVWLLGPPRPCREPRLCVQFSS
jgi:hypothetical protein